MKYFYLVSLAAYIISYLIFFNLCNKLGLEKLISPKTSRRIILFVITFLFSFVGFLITDSLNITKEYRSLIDSFFIYGPAMALFVFVLPVKLNRNI